MWHRDDDGSTTRWRLAAVVFCICVRSLYAVLRSTIGRLSLFLRCCVSAGRWIRVYRGKKRMSGYRKVNYYELCRLCTSSEGSKVNIFREEGRRRQLQTKIQTYLPIQVSVFARPPARPRGPLTTRFLDDSSASLLLTPLVNSDNNTRIEGIRTFQFTGLR